MDTSVLIPVYAALLLLAAALAFALLMRNRALRRVVDSRTEELNKAVQSLKANTDRLRELCSSVPCGYHALNAGGVFVEINDTELAWLGCTRGELIGKLTFADFLDTASREKYLAEIALCKSSGASRSAQYELNSRAGARMTVIVSSTVSADTNGEHVITRATVFDITQQMRAHRALSATLDHTPNVAIQWFDRDGRVRYWNKAAATLFGWSAEEVMGRTLGEIGFYTPMQDRDFIDVLREIDAEGQALEPSESTFFRKDGSQGVLVSTLFPIPSPSGESYIACMDIDVTERHRSEERLRATLEHTPGVAVQWYDGEGRVLYWNPASEMLYGIDAEEAVGRRMDELLFNADEYREFMRYFDALKHAHNTSDETRIVVRGRHGVEMTVLRRACVIPGERGEPIFVCMEVDVTDARVAEREREQLSTILTRVTETIPVCLSYIDPEGRYVWTNAHNSERLGTTPDRMIGKTVREVLFAATGESGRTAFEAAQVGEPQHDEREWHHHNGETRTYERYVVPDKDAAGRLRGCTSVWVDITGRKEAERKIQRLNRVHSVLSNIDAALVRTKNRQELFEEACRIAVHDGGFGVAWIGVFNRFTMRVDSVALSGADAMNLQVVESLSRDLANAGCQLMGRCIRTKRPIIENNMSMKNPPEGTLRRRAVELGYQSVIFLPMVVRGEVAGIISMLSKEPDFFTDEEVRLLTSLASDVAFAVEGIDKETRINYLANYDLLTGLPNRSLFQERLNQLIQSSQPRGLKAAVLLVDIRRFRFVNETLGRQSADHLLSRVAERFLLSWPEPDNVGRISGDRFAFALGRYDNNALLVHAVQRSIIEALKSPFSVEEQEITVTAAAGIAVFPDDGADVEELFKNAEAALGQAKSHAEPYMFYQRQMNARMAEGLQIENDMRRALEREQFVMHYQPKVIAATARVCGFEALIRWNDPQAGMVGPNHFIPVLEETGMIVEVGQWAIRSVLCDQASWRAQGLMPQRVAVNVSAVQLLRKDFTDQVRTLLAETVSGEPALELEITESLLMKDVEGCIAKLKILRDLGVSIAIDDFGTGYSSLAYLSKLPVNALKIDRSFVDGMLRSDEYMSIVSTIISLAHAMKIKVVAEGVETPEQLNVLRSLDCDEVQGYFISRPVAADAAGRMLDRHAIAAVG